MSSAPTLPTDQEILDGIRRRDNTTVSAVYQQFRPRIVAHLGSLNGSKEEAKDIFQEALVVVFMNAQKPDFQLTSSFYTYLFAICHHLWLKKFREKKRREQVSLEPGVVLLPETDPSESMAYAARQQLLLEKFNALSEGCRELLRLAIVEEKTPAEIVQTFGFGSIEYYYKRKSNCKDKLTELVRADARFAAL